MAAGHGSASFDLACQDGSNPLFLPARRLGATVVKYSSALWLQKLRPCSRYQGNISLPQGQMWKGSSRDGQTSAMLLV